MKTLKNVRNLTLNDVKINSIIKIQKQMFTIYSIRKDGKIYFQNNTTGEEYTTNLEQIKQEGWKIINPE